MRRIPRGTVSFLSSCQTRVHSEEPLARFRSSRLARSPRSGAHSSSKSMVFEARGLSFLKERVKSPPILGAMRLHCLRAVERRFRDFGRNEREFWREDCLEAK